MKNTMWVIIGIIVIGIIVGLIFGVRDAAENAEPSDELLKEMFDDEAEENDSSAGFNPVKEMPDNTETTQLSAVGTYTGSGVATRLFADGAFTHTITARVSPPATGKFYEGWLVMPGPQFFSTGKLEMSGAAYTLSYTADQNYPDHTDVVITEETTSQGLDNNPEAHVLEGSF
jgi:hypothetical protein